MQQEEWQEDVAAQYVGENMEQQHLELRLPADEDEDGKQTGQEESKVPANLADDVMRRIEENRLKAKKRLEALQAQSATG
eukprot:765540-Hanusia_phi.AAC.2